MLSKYDCLPDHFHDLKTTLQTEFNLLKKAISKNIENIQEAIQSQQAYTMALCSPDALSICPPQLDVVQLNAPKYNPDIDGQPDPVQDIQSQNNEDTTSNTTNSEQHTALCPNTNRPESQPSSVLDDTDHPDTKTPNNQGQSTQVITDPNWKTSQN